MMTNDTLEPQTPEKSEDTLRNETIVDVLRGIQAELKQLNKTLSGMSAGQPPRFPRSGSAGPAHTEGVSSFDTPKPRRTSPKNRTKGKGKLPAKKGGGYPKNPR